MERDDIVLFVQYGGRTYVEIPETVTGEMASYNIRNVDNQYMVVDGEQYHDDVLKLSGSVDDEVTKFDVTKCETDKDGVQFDATYNFYLDDFGHIVAFAEVEGAADNYALVLNSAWTRNALTNRGEVKVLMSDGTEATYAVNMDASADNFPGADDDDRMDSLKDFLGTDDVVVGNWNPANYAAGELITYSLNESTEEITIAPADYNLYSGNYDDNNNTAIIAPNGRDYSDGNPVVGATLAQQGGTLSRGDTYLTVNDNATYLNSDGDVVDPWTSQSASQKNRVGIDAETIVFYYEQGTGEYGVAIGYDNMSTEDVPAGTAMSAVMYNPDSGTSSKVAEVLVLDADPKFSTENYALVLETHDRDKD